MSQQELTQAIIACNGDAAKIQALLAANKTTTSTANGLKVSEKGGVSLYGLGRFPITLYASQWSAVAEKMPEILAFIDANRDVLKSKDTAEKTGNA